MKGKLYLVATPIGNLEDISHRAIRILQEVDMVAAEDTRHSIKLLNYLDIKKPMISYFEHNKRERGEIIISHILEGKNIALITDAGTPAISDPGEDLVKLAIENDITVEPIPGAVALITALIASGLPTGRFSFQGFLTTNKKGRKEHLESIKNMIETQIFYEAPHKLKNTLKDMYSILGNRKICLCREMTKKFEQYIRCDILNAIEYFETTQPKGEFVLVIEGASAEIKKTDATLQDIFKDLKMQGLDEKDAIKEAAKIKGISKRDAYKILKID